MDKNWDILVIFDAMRWQEGSKILPKHFEGNIKLANTGCSTTFQWYKKHWQTPTDVILVSGNPQPWHKNSNFAYKNFKIAHMSFGKTWVAVDPVATWGLFLSLYENAPNEKYLVHLLPPHLPFYFGAGGELMKELQVKPLDVYTNTQAWGQQGDNFTLLKKYYQEQIVGISELIAATLYKLDPSKRLVITADHGELIGFKGIIYDHPPDPTPDQKPHLYQVPWLDVNITGTLIKQRLAMLGYMND